MDAPTSRFVELLGATLESDGYPPVAGRLLGLLLVREDTASLDEIAEQLAVTKASVSINARLLERRGVVERVTRPGDRRDHYRVAPDLLARTMEQRLERWRRFRDAIISARSTLRIRSDIIRGRLDELEQAYEHVLDITTKALDDWRSRRAASAADGTRAP